MDSKPADQQQTEGAGQGPSSEALAAAVQAATASFAKRNRGNRSNLRKRPAEEEGSGQPTDNVTAEDDDPTVVQRKAKAIRGEPLAFTNKTENTESVHVAFESSRTIQSGKDESVFKVLETETQTDRDAR